MKLHTIHAGLFKLDGGAMFGVVPRSMWEKLNIPDSKGLCTWAMRCLLIEDGKRLILVDCGMGNKQDAKFFSHYEPHGQMLSQSLRDLGFHEEDITDVLLTHLHFDHCGGAIKREGEKLVPAFKNATYWSNVDHWEWATKPNAREKASFLKENILPIQESGQLKFVKDNSNEIHENITVKTVSGHTESMLIPHIKVGKKTIVYATDLFPSKWHLPLPYIMAYDTRPLLTMNEKERFLKEIADNNYYLFYEHDPLTEISTLHHTERGIREKESLLLADL